MTLLTLLLTAVAVAAADQSFTPSHALAAKLRFEAHRDGDTYTDHTPALPVLDEAGRAWYKQQEADRRQKRLAALEAQYEQQLAAHLQSQQPESQEDKLLARIETLENKLIEAHEQKLAELEAAQAEQTEEAAVEAEESAVEADTDDTDVLKAAAIGGGATAAAGLGLAGLAGLFRRRKSSETDTNLDTGFDS